MVTVQQTVLTLLILQIYVSAAPSDVPKPEELEKLDAQPTAPHNNVNATENQRQKRYFNHFDFPPFAPPPFHSYHKRDQSADTAVYGLTAPEDPYNGIHRRLQEIASAVRQTVPPPPPPPIAPHFPFYLPVIYIPQFGCSCEPTNTQTTEKPQSPPPTEGTTNGTSPDIENRFPEMDDERQNWGLVADDTEGDDNGEDFSRPISFDPIRLDTSNSKRPAPPVEHGSNQAGGSAVGTTTTVKPAPPSNDVPSSSPTLTGTMAAAPYPSRQPPKQAPTSCDGAVLSCCHMPQVTYDCFAVLGCPDPTSYGNPCDPLVILKVITKFQNYYGVKRA